MSPVTGRGTSLPAALGAGKGAEKATVVHGMVTSDDLIFVLRKAAGLAVSPVVWLLLGLALAWWLSWRGRARGARRILGLLLAGLLLVSFVPLGWSVLAEREARYPPEPPLTEIGGIILLGGAERLEVSAHRGRPELNEAADRVIAAATLARRFPGVPMLVTGGHGTTRNGVAIPGEAGISARILTALGVARDRLIIEDRARNTAENARLSLARVTPEPDRPWVLVTSAFHMPRAMAEFTAAGWPAPVPWPVDFRTAERRDALGWRPLANMARLGAALREMLGALALWLGGAG